MLWLLVVTAPPGGGEGAGSPPCPPECPCELCPPRALGTGHFHTSMKTEALTGAMIERDSVESATMNR